LVTRKAEQAVGGLPSPNVPVERGKALRADARVLRSMR
jgi:hypothetical protein